jgi:hypothetical protein
MPDLTIMGAWTCTTNLDWSTTVSGSKGTDYVVRFGRLNNRDRDIQGCQYGWTCTCKGFAFRGTCSHWTKVEASKDRCGWNACLEPTLEPDWSKSKNEPCCPECGAEVQAFNVGV